MLDIIGSNPKSYYMFEGEKIFHDEERCWAAALEAVKVGVFTEDQPEWMDWWQADIDATVRPGSFDQPVFTLADAELKPRFRKMTRAQLRAWLEGRGFRVPAKATLPQMISHAERVWDDRAR